MSTKKVKTITSKADDFPFVYESTEIKRNEDGSYRVVNVYSNPNTGEIRTQTFHRVWLSLDSSISFAYGEELKVPVIPKFDGVTVLPADGKNSGELWTLEVTNKNNKMWCKDDGCSNYDVETDSCTRTSTDGTREGVCWMEKGEGEY